VTNVKGNNIIQLSFVGELTAAKYSKRRSLPKALSGPS
jgi:hypothetical protein